MQVGEGTLGLQEPAEVESRKEVCTVKRLLVVLVMMFATLALGQHSQFNPIVDSPVDFAQVSDSQAYVAGNWVALDERSKLPGVSVSEISCDRAQKVCHELQANLVFVGGDEFSLMPDAVNYNVVRWNSKEIVAQSIGGICKALNSLRFDLLTKRVYYLQSLSEPVESLPELSKKMCNAIGLRLELHAKSAYSTRPTLIKDGKGK